MPELPEVEAARRLCEHHALGATLDNIDFLIEDEIVFGMSENQIRPTFNQLKCLSLSGTGRHGKYFWLTFSSASQGLPEKHVVLHFGMTGFVQVKGAARSLYRSAPHKPGEPDVWPPRFTRFILEFSSSCLIAFGDPRRLARVKVVDTVATSIKHLGFDPILSLSNHFTDFYQMLAKRNAPIKALMLDQTFVAGVGNWMADDILKRAKLHPASVSSKLSEKNAFSLFDAIISLSQDAVECKLGGKDYPDDWLFHIRWQTKKQIKKTLAGDSVECTKIGGRTTVYCPDIQRKP